MGCECQKNDEKIDELKSEESTKNNERDQLQENLSKRIDNSKILNLESQSNGLQPVDPKGKPTDDFSRYVFALINSLRLNPASYIDTLLRAKNNVVTDQNGIKIYKSSVKVALNSGEKAFDRAIKVLRDTEPMNKLVYNPNLVIELPTNENDLKSKAYLPAQIKKKIDNGVEIKSFWKDIVKDPDTCFILTIVDDSGKHAGNKRSDILDRNNKYIGISSVKIGKTFACYIVIS
jgi:hypothetical protein